jgi:hypothetical protein
MDPLKRKSAYADSKKPNLLNILLYPSIKIILTGATLYWQNLIISALKGSLPVFRGQGREHSDQFL